MFSIPNAHVKVFASLEVDGSQKMTLKAWLSNMRSWSEPDLAPHDHVYAAHPGAGGDLEHARPLKAEPVPA
jgi:hypothetical protein